MVKKVLQPAVAWNINRVRFDEKLGYHLFTEEMSINLKKHYWINSAVLQVDCCHYSWGSKTPEYFEALEYVKKKHGLERFICTPELSCMDGEVEDNWN
jgi:hypothetical protein